VASGVIVNPLATYLHDLRDIRPSGANVSETSFYGPLANLLNEIGQTLKPRVHCIINLKNQGGRLPDGGFFTADQLPRMGEPDLHAQWPARGVMEVNGTGIDNEGEDYLYPADYCIFVEFPHEVEQALLQVS
jgi:hypothetical protein